MPYATVVARIAFLAIAATVCTGYEAAEPGYEYEFPRDHFEHPDFAMEWWYYTGSLADARGRKFGFDLTFFRAAPERTGTV